jgi:hypothetical protein
MGTKAEHVPDSRKLFVEHFKSRPDIGFLKMLLNVALQARDPFKPWEPRKWKKEFVAVALVVLLTAVWLGYWNMRH